MKISKHIYKDIIYFFILSLVGGIVLFWHLDQVPVDLDGEMALVAQSAYLVDQAKAQKVSFSKLIQESGQGAPMKKTYGVPTYHLYLQILGRSLPLWMFILSNFLKIFGSTKFAVCFASSLIGISIIFLTYFITRKMYSRNIGFLAAFLLCFSLYFLIDVRSGWGYHAIPGFFALIGVYLLYQAFSTDKKIYFYIYGFTWGIAWLNGYSPHLIIIATFILALIAIRKNLMFLKQGYFWLTIAIAFFTCFILSIVYSYLFNLDSPIQSFQELNRHWLFRRGGEEVLFLSGSFFSNLITAFKNIFIGMTYDKASHTSLIVPGVPVINIFISIFFIKGLISSLRRRDTKDILLLLWLGLVFINFTCFVVFQVRYIMIIAPAICIITAKSIVDSINSRQLLKWRRRILILFVVFGIGFSSFYNYYNYFVVYAGNDAYLWRFVGNKEIAEYISTTSRPQECEVVFGHPVLVPAENFIFYTKEMYPIRRWKDIHEDSSFIKVEEYERGVFAQGKKIIFYVFSMDNESNKAPGKRAWGDYENMSFFRKVHPNLKPSKIINYSSGLAAFEIFEVTEPPKVKYTYPIGINDQKVRAQIFFSKHSILESIKFQISYRGKQEYLQPLILELRKVIDGKEPDMTKEGVISSFTILPQELNLKEGNYSVVNLAESKIDPGKLYAIIWRQGMFDENNYYVLAGQGKDIYDKGHFGYYDGHQWVMSKSDANVIITPSKYTFEQTASEGNHTLSIKQQLKDVDLRRRIIFSEAGWNNLLFDCVNLKYQESDDGQFRWILPENDSGGYLVYKIDSFHSIDSINIVSNPRIHNDQNRENYLKLAYSVDGNKYYEVYRLESKGSKGWTGIFEEERYSTIKVNNNVVYLRFDFNGENTQLWATRSRPLSFDIKVKYNH